MIYSLLEGARTEELGEVDDRVFVGAGEVVDPQRVDCLMAAAKAAADWDRAAMSKAVRSAAVPA